MLWDSRLQLQTFLSIMWRDLMLNLCQKPKQLKSQLLLLTKESWSLLLTIAIFPMPRTMNTMELQSQPQFQWWIQLTQMLFPNLWLLLFLLLQLPKLLSLSSRPCPLMAHNTIPRMILANTHLDTLMENLSNRRSKLLMELLEGPTSMLMLMELFKQSTTLLMPLDSELEPLTFLSIMLRDLMLNLSKKSKQLRSQLLLLTKVPWNPLSTIA